MKYPLLPGESILDNAPSTRLSNGKQCMPQHYLVFNHNANTVKNILSAITYSARYPLFVCEDDSGLYIQVGIIGADNYPTNGADCDKIVYGRKWRIEPQLPTSEIIQTAFLALQKAREHEVREMFRLEENGFTCTPFNNHHDLPLMAQHHQLLERPQLEKYESIDEVRSTLAKLHYDHCHFELISITSLKKDLWLMDIKLHKSDKTRLQELIDRPNEVISILLHQYDSNHLYHQLMDVCLDFSNRHVEENFSYNGFSRFNREHNIESIASLSTSLRKQHLDSEFHTEFKKNNYETDLTRVPVLDNSLYSDRLRQQLEQHSPLSGILPVDVDQ